MALLPIGPCRALGPAAAVVSYTIYNAFMVNIGFTVGAAMYFRYSAINMVDTTRTKVILSILLSYVIPVSMNYVQHLTPKRSHCLPRGFQ
nr:7TM GPCR domain containing protein [Haemonchus contortus]